jgi:acyl-CoA reductase-like NAD-dependent aldehyde dehydrogenase
MSFTDQLSNIFLTEEEIPDEFNLDTEVHQKDYLSNGEMKQWDGAVHEVYSPVCVRTAGGLKRKLIGSYPICSNKEAMEALDAAVAAYDKGRGEWPTMAVADRITCVEKFTREMLLQKEIVVKVLCRLSKRI